MPYFRFTQQEMADWEIWVQAADEDTAYDTLGAMWYLMDERGGWDNTGGTIGDYELEEEVSDSDASQEIQDAAISQRYRMMRRRTGRPGEGATDMAMMPWRNPDSPEWNLHGSMTNPTDDPDHKPARPADEHIVYGEPGLLESYQGFIPPWRGDDKPRERRAGAARSSASRRRGPGMQRKFGPGRRFVLAGRSRNKGMARSLAANMRRQDYNARVVQVKGGWAVYHRGR